MQIVPRGVIQTPVTPLTADNVLDIKTLEKLIDFHIRQEGTVAISLPMHIGESLSLTVEERKRLVEVSVKVSAGRVPIIVHVSMPGTDQTVDLAKHAESVGADGILCVPSYYWRSSPDAMFDHFVSVGTCTGLPLIAYNSPHLLPVEIPVELLTRLVERLDTLVGLKDASFDMEYFTEVCRRVIPLRPTFAVICGVEYLLPTLPLGASGSMSTLGGVAPRLVHKLYQACVSHDFEQARQLQFRASQLWHLLKVEYPSTIKTAMEIMGRPVGTSRLPVPSLDKNARKRLLEELQALKVLDEEPRGW